MPRRCSSILAKVNFIVDHCVLHNFCRGSNPKIRCVVQFFDWTTNSWATAAFVKKTNLQKTTLEAKSAFAYAVQKYFSLKVVYWVVLFLPISQYFGSKLRKTKEFLKSCQTIGTDCVLIVWQLFKVFWFFIIFGHTVEKSAKIRPPSRQLLARNFFGLHKQRPIWPLKWSFWRFVVYIIASVAQLLVVQSKRCIWHCWSV